MGWVFATTIRRSDPELNGLFLPQFDHGTVLAGDAAGVEFRPDVAQQVVIDDAFDGDNLAGLHGDPVAPADLDAEITGIVLKLEHVFVGDPHDGALNRRVHSSFQRLDRGNGYRCKGKSRRGRCQKQCRANRYLVEDSRF